MLSSDGEDVRLALEVCSEWASGHLPLPSVELRLTKWAALTRSEGCREGELSQALLSKWTPAGRELGSSFRMVGLSTGPGEYGAHYEGWLCCASKGEAWASLAKSALPSASPGSLPPSSRPGPAHPSSLEVPDLPRGLSGLQRDGRQLNYFDDREYDGVKEVELYGAWISLRRIGGEGSHASDSRFKDSNSPLEHFPSPPTGHGYTLLRMLR